MLAMHDLGFFIMPAMLVGTGKNPGDTRHAEG